MFSCKRLLNFLRSRHGPVGGTCAPAPEAALFLKSLLASLSLSGRHAALPRLPEGMRVYAFGDVHGRADLLGQLLDAIAADTADGERDWDQLRVIGLGDYVDRGLESRDVLEILTSRGDAIGLTALRGNHEEAMLRALGDSAAIAPWLEFGGAATLASYHISPPAGVTSASERERIAAAMAARIPRHHVDFLRATTDSLHLGDYFFVHAGIRPGLALSEQKREDLLWIRHQFLASRRRHGAMIVHGHHIVAQPDIRPNRVGLDTGAYCTGVLSCLVVQDSRSRLIQVTPQGIKKTALPPR